MQLPAGLAVARAPFRLQTLPDDSVPHASWRRASKDALAALGRGESVAVLGLAGTGKTLLLESLGQILRSEGVRVRSLGVQQAPEPGTLAGVLLLDEADRLPGDVLDGLRDEGGSAILAGLPDFAARLDRHAFPATIVRLEPLSLEDVTRFVAGRLSAAGQRHDLFEADAVLALARRSAGLLRLVIALAGAAMFLADHEGAEHVSARHVEEAAAMRETGRGDGAVNPTAAIPAPGTSAAIFTPTLPGPGPAPRTIPFPRARQVALCAGGVGLLLMVGWMLSGRSVPPILTPPQHAAAVDLAPAAVPVPRPAPVDLTIARPLGASRAPNPVTPSGPAARPDAGAAPAPPASATPGRVAAAALPGTREIAVAFQGPILNETMNQQGQLSLGIRRWGATNVTTSFQASAGLIGTGDLTGTLTADGRLVVSGRLMMGRNSFDSTLVATIVGDRLKGTATFARPDSGSIARSSFSLTRL